MGKNSVSKGDFKIANAIAHPSVTVKTNYFSYYTLVLSFFVNMAFITPLYAVQEASKPESDLRLDSAAIDTPVPSEVSLGSKNKHMVRKDSNFQITNVEINLKTEKLSLFAKLNMLAKPSPDDYILVLLNGVSLVNTSFNNFNSTGAGVYEYARKGFRASVNFNNHLAEFTRPNVNVDALSVNNGIDALVQFGDTQLTAHFKGSVTYK